MDLFSIAPNRKALITGGASGFGLAIAERLVRCGASVAIADIEAGKLADARTRLGTGVLAVTMDVTKRDSVTAGVQTVADSFGGLDTLVTDLTGHF